MRARCSASASRAARRWRGAAAAALTAALTAAMAAAMALAAGTASAQQHGAGPPLEPAIQSFEVGGGVYVRSLAIDRARNALWVGTSVGAMEIDLASRDLKQVFTRADGLANEYVFAIGVAPSGDVWFGTNAGGASRYRDGAWTTFFPMHGLADYWVYGFAFEADGDVWIGTWNGASRFDPRTGGFTNFRDELVNIWVYGLDIDAAGRVWFGTEGGVSMLEHGRWRAWTHEDGLGVPNLQSLPPSPNTGLGTRARHDLSVGVGSGESYNPNYVFAARADRDGRRVWFGTWGGGASVIDGAGAWTSYSVRDGLAGNIVYSIEQADDGTLWFGTNRGVSSFDGASWTTYRHGLPASDIYAIAIEDHDTIWLGTRGAVVLLQAGGAGAAR